MSTSKIPMLAVGLVDDVWTVAIADQFGWVTAGTGEPLDDAVVGTWTHLGPLGAEDVLRAGSTVAVYEDNTQSGVGVVKHHGNLTGPLVVVVPVERVP